MTTPADEVPENVIVERVAIPEGKDLTEFWDYVNNVMLVEMAEKETTNHGL